MIDLKRFKKVKVVSRPGRLIVNDGSHGPHNAENPDDGSTSEFAIALGEKLKEIGIATKVSRLPE